MIHSTPRCLECSEPVSPADLIFAPPCGSTSEHDRCGSAVWHPLCLMIWRERVADFKAEHRRIQMALREFFQGIFDPDAE